MITKGLFSSNTDMWATPQWLFDKLDEEFHFTVDVCAVVENAKCRTFFSPEMDGLSINWNGGGCYLLVQSALRTADRKVGQEGSRERLDGRHASPGTNRYGVVSRLHTRQGRNSFPARAAQIRRQQK